VPAYVALGQFTKPNAIATAVLLPLAIISTFSGVRLVRKVSAERLQTMIYLATLLIGAKLLWGAVL
jgi:hypothetical protein